MSETTDTYEPALEELNRNVPLSQKLTAIHRALNRQLPMVDRVSVAVYDPKTDLLKTFLHSSGGIDPLPRHQARLSEVRSLREVVESGQARIVNDLPAHYRGPDEHSRKLAAQGYGSSFTQPMYFNGMLFGFVFFNAYSKHAFHSSQFPLLELYGRLVSLTVTGELAVLHTMLAAIKVARDMTAFRDVETGAHLDRMARYARLIAKALAPRFGFSDEYVEHVFLFAPLHDIGKIAIPDRILFKEKGLTAAEFERMKEHTRKGREMIDSILSEFGLNTLPYVDVLRNITEFHHERLDATGYPKQLRGKEIPIEARIIAVADIFDALTSRRPYKHAWSNEEAFALLRSLEGTKIDADCVAALIAQQDKIEALQAQFKDDETQPMPPAGLVETDEGEADQRAGRGKRAT